MGEAAYILGVMISRDRSKKLVSLSQEQYIKKILERFRMQDCKPIDTLMEKGETLSRRLCPKTSRKKGTNEHSYLLKCGWKSDVL